MAFPIDWSGSFRLQADYHKVSGSTDLTDFPVLISDSNLSDEVYAGLETDGKDLRITTDSAGTTEIPFEIVSLNTSIKKCEIWVKIPTLSYNSNTSIYIWYGNSSATAYAITDTYGSQNVWTSGYQAVYHLNANGNDSSSNGYTATGTDPNYTTAKFGNGGDFDLSNSEYLEVANASCPNLNMTGSQSWSAWVKTPSSFSGTPRIIAKVIGSDSNARRDLYLGYIDGIRYPVFMVGGFGVVSYVQSAISLSTDTWYKITGIYDSSTNELKIWVNVTLTTENNMTGSPDTSVSPFQIAHGRFYVTAPDQLDQFWNGIITNITVRSVAPSNDWMITEYNNQNEPGSFWNNEQISTASFKVALSGIDALTDTNPNNFSLYVDTNDGVDYTLIKEKARGTGTNGYFATASEITHDLGYLPFYLSYVEVASGRYALSNSFNPVGLGWASYVSTSKLYIRNRFSESYTHYRYYIFYDNMN
jgi:hypothetical protein